MSSSNIKILVSAYACEPDLGSEIGVGWNWILQMSRFFELFVVTRRSNKNSIESWILLHDEYKNIHFIYYDLPQCLRFWKKGMRGVRVYYNLWQLAINKIVRKTMKDNDIKVFHHLTYGNILWSVSNYGQKHNFIYGPVGGMETIPLEFFKHYNVKTQLLEIARHIVVCLQKINPFFLKRCRNADLILCKTETTQRSISAKYRYKTLLFTDVAANDELSFPLIKKSEIVDYICVGRIDAWRGFDIAIEAFAKLFKVNNKTRLTIVGEGYDKKRLIKIVNDNNLSSVVRFVGNVSHTEYIQLLEKSDVLVNPALKEGGVTVSFDALSVGKPIICLNTSGYTSSFTADFSRVINVTNRLDTIEQLAEAMIELSDETVRLSMSENTHLASIKLNWNHKAISIYNIIDNFIKLKEQ